MRQESFCPMASCEAAEAGNEITNDMSLEESFPELRVQNGLHVRWAIQRVIITKEQFICLFTFDILVI